MLGKLVCVLAVIGSTSSWVHAEPVSNVVVVDVAGFRAEHVLRGRRAAEDDIRAGALGFYLSTCSFPGLSKKDSRKLKRQKEYLSKIGVNLREYDKCNDLVEEAQRLSAFVEGYNAASRAQIAKRTGRAVPF